MINEAIKQLVLELLEDKSEAVTIGQRRKISDAKRLRYANDDHFNNGKDWRGRRPANNDYSEVADLFTQDDEIGPALARRVDHTFAKDFEFAVTDVTSEDADQSEITTALTEWDRACGIQFETRRLKSEMDTLGTAAFRVYIPLEYEPRAGMAKTLSEALELIHVHVVTKTQGGVLRDQHNRDVGYCYHYQIERDGKAVQEAEIHTADQIGVYTINGETLEPISAVPNPLFDETRKRRPHYLMRSSSRFMARSVITQSMIDLQDRLNIARTNDARNNDQMGYKSVAIVNAESRKTNTGEKLPWMLGPKKVLEVRGLLVDDKDLGKTRLTPTIIQIDPHDPQKFSLPTIEELKLTLMAKFNQSWTAATALEISGESKIQSRKAFDQGIISESVHVIEALRWLFGTVLSLAAWLEGNPAKYQNLTVEPKLFLDVARGNLELFKVMIGAFEKNLVSLETVIETNPAVADSSSEIARLQQPQRLTPALADAAVTSGRLSRQASLENVGYDPIAAAAIVAQSLEEAQQLAGGVTPEGDL